MCTEEVLMKKISKISLLHIYKLVFRSCLFIAVIIFDILNRTDVLTYNAILPCIVWLSFFIEMILRFFPSDFESMGCQKQFRRNYEANEECTTPQNQSWKVTALVAVLWLTMNGVIGLLYFLCIFDRAILVLIAIGYSVCDIICILFFCPFQTWIMKNRCCTTCRIYNWDFAMMFTPLVFIPSVYTYTLLGLALLLLLYWEVCYRLYPERFSPATNKCLDCSRCQEKLCSHKKQLQGFLKKYKKKFFPPKNTKTE